MTIHAVFLVLNGQFRHSLLVIGQQFKRPLVEVVASRLKNGNRKFSSLVVRIERFELVLYCGVILLCVGQPYFNDFIILTNVDLQIIILLVANSFLGLLALYSSFDQRERSIGYEREQFHISLWDANRKSMRMMNSRSHSPHRSF